MNKSIDSFNIRVYALIIENDNILISKELIKGEIVLKFPGGGVEHGEGIIDALQREANEELSQELEEITHFYTTDFFQQSAYDIKDQLIAIYYLVSTKEKLNHEKIIGLEDEHEFTWIPIKNHEYKLDFPIDKLVYNKLQ